MCMSESEVLINFLKPNLHEKVTVLWLMKIILALTELEILLSRVLVLINLF